MKINLLKITKCFAYYICSEICISDIFFKYCCAQILKVKSKISFTLRKFDRSINIKVKNDLNLKLIPPTRLKQMIWI